MQRSTSLALLAAFFVLVSCRRESPTPPSDQVQGDVLKEREDIAMVPQGEPLTRTELDRLVIGMLEDQNDFQWSWVDTRTLWSAALLGDGSVAVGYKPAQMGDITSIIHHIDLGSGEWKAVHDALIDLVLTEVNGDRRKPLTAAEIIIEDDPVLPIITFRLTDKEALTRLRNLENVRYLEPDYWPASDVDRSTSGCNASTYALNAADWTTITPNARLPWNFNNMGIPAAWGSAQGLGITVGVIDAGIGSSQTLLGSQFNNGDSNVGRGVTTAYTYGTSAFTNCTHGTSMTGLAVGPRNSLNGATGVAYKSSLHFVRGCEDVVLDKSGERTGVKNALIQMGNRADVRVVSMSVGTPFYSGVLLDGVTYAYNNGKMLMAAAGTSFSWTSWWGVVYPAAFSQCTAITGVNESGSTCNSCHDGSQVDFTIPMERNGNTSRNSLSLPLTGATPTYIGGSSAATATAAGVAALVWGVNPAFTRAQVLNCLTTTAQFYPSPSGSKGYGNLNAAAAVNCALTL